MRDIIFGDADTSISYLDTVIPKSDTDLAIRWSVFLSVGDDIAESGHPELRIDREYQISIERDTIITRVDMREDEGSDISWYHLPFSIA